MATSNFLMQARHPVDGTLATWRSSTPDRTALFAPTLPSPHDGPPLEWQDICVSGGGIEGPDITPDGAMTFDDGSFVVFDDGSFAVTT